MSRKLQEMDVIPFCSKVSLNTLRVMGGQDILYQDSERETGKFL